MKCWWETRVILKTMKLPFVQVKSAKIYSFDRAARGRYDRSAVHAMTRQKQDLVFCSGTHKIGYRIHRIQLCRTTKHAMVWSVHAIGHLSWLDNPLISLTNDCNSSLIWFDLENYIT